MKREYDRPGSQALSASEQIDSSGQCPKGLRVLVVEHVEETALTTALRLRTYGHEVRVARDGPTAVQEAQDCPPDVVLLDIHLPGVDGYQVASAIERQPGEKRPLFIALTGHGKQAERRHSKEAVIDLHLVKPLDYDRLQGLLKRFQAVIH